jgi:hypothetical protein
MRGAHAGSTASDLHGTRFNNTTARPRLPHGLLPLLPRSRRGVLVASAGCPGKLAPAANLQGREVHA